jgi:hypothetical protein
MTIANLHMGDNSPTSNAIFLTGEGSAQRRRSHSTLEETEEEFDLDSDSDTDSIYGEPCEVPADLNSDLHLINPQEWDSHLSDVEKRIIERSVFSQNPFPADLSWEQLRLAYSQVIGNYDSLQTTGYCNDRINAVISCARRPNVANLQDLSIKHFSDIRTLIHHHNIGPCLKLLRSWGFIHTCNSIVAEPVQERRALMVANASVRFLGHAVACFSRAHLGLPNENAWSTRVWSTIILRPRPLKCLDGYLGQRSVYVFEDNGDGIHTPAGPVYISTTLHNFNAIWGPVWASHPGIPGYKQPENHWTKPVTKYDLSRGSIIPWERTTEDPDLLEHEIFAHWTEDKNTIQNASQFPACEQEPRLLVGTSPRLSVTKDCQLKLEQWTTTMRQSGRCMPLGTRRTTRYRDSQTYTTSLSSYGVSVGYQEQWKIRGTTLKERMLAVWINEPEKRNPNIVANRLLRQCKATNFGAYPCFFNNTNLSKVDQF